ncbi:ribose-5-phosphate isomerase A [uncultured Lactobacillus sp.]|uniref:ribose-5-phosphate isomerase A n=1 Tax=uncultured Lactobacillus sp. TaxID=153152 RepID=UPI00261989ED|nr:ribose-5-phosphate isomerase A [uncultured Lactobacillus sp.]
MTTISSLAFSKIKPNSNVSLGGGSNVFNLAKEIERHTEYKLHLYSPSTLTIMKCKSVGLFVKTIQEATTIDLAFDGCDSVDYDLNALKSNGGIHYFEKIAAQKSKEYVLLLPKKRLTPTLSNKIQLCLEVTPDSAGQIIKICHKMNLQATIRKGRAIADLVYTKNGNLLLDIFSSSWAEIDQINQKLINQNGVVASSYFKNLVTNLITGNEDEDAVEIKKGDLK